MSTASTARIARDNSSLAALSTLSLESIRSKPESLKTEAISLDEQLSSLCLRHVHSFVSVHAANQSLAPAISAISMSLKDLAQTALPALQASAETFEGQVQPSLLSRGQVQNLADQNAAGLGALLELPPLVDTCVAARHYTEALSLGAHIAALLQQNVSDSSDGHSAAGSVLEALKNETWKTLGRMRAELLQTFLRPSLKLPMARRTLTHLRKLSELDRLLHTSDGNPAAMSPLGLSEDKVCLLLLRSRSAQLSKLSSAAKYSGLATVGSQAKKMSLAVCEGIRSSLQAFIDAWRDIVSDTCGLGIALFTNRAAATSDQEPRQGTVSLHLLSAFANQALLLLQDTIADQLERLVPAGSDAVEADILEAAATALSSLQTQTSYAAASLGRVGIDFTYLLGSPSPLLQVAHSEMLFEAMAPRLFVKPLRNATESLVGRIGSIENGGDVQVWPSQWLVTDKHLAEQFQAPVTIELDAYAPPLTIASFPPLANFTNSLSTGLNILRAFPPHSALPSIRVELASFLTTIGDGLVRYAQVIAEDSSISPPRIRLPSLLPVDETAVLSAPVEDARARQAQSFLLARALKCFQTEVARWAMLALEHGVYGIEKASVECTEMLSTCLQRVASERVQLEQMWAMGEEQRKLMATEKRAEIDRQVAAQMKKDELIAEEENRRRQDARVAQLRRLEEQRREQEERLVNERTQEEQLLVARAEEARLQRERMELEKLPKERSGGEDLETHHTAEVHPVPTHLELRGAGVGLAKPPVNLAASTLAAPTSAASTVAAPTAAARTLAKEKDNTDTDPPTIVLSQSSATDATAVKSTDSSMVEEGESRGAVESLLSKQEATANANISAPAVSSAITLPKGPKLTLAEKLKLRAEERERARQTQHSSAEPSQSRTLGDDHSDHLDSGSTGEDIATRKESSEPDYPQSPVALEQGVDVQNRDVANDGYNGGTASIVSTVDDSASSEVEVDSGAATQPPSDAEAEKGGDVASTEVASIGDSGTRKKNKKKKKKGGAK